MENLTNIFGLQNIAEEIFLNLYQNDSNLIDGATLCLIIGKIVQSALKGMKMYFIKKAMARHIKKIWTIFVLMCDTIFISIISMDIFHLHFNQIFNSTLKHHEIECMEQEAMNCFQDHISSIEVADGRSNS